MGLHSMMDFRACAVGLMTSPPKGHGDFTTAPQCPRYEIAFVGANNSDPRTMVCSIYYI